MSGTMRYVSSAYQHTYRVEVTVGVRYGRCADTEVIPFN